MFDGVTGTTAVTLTAKRTAAAAPIPALPVEAERVEQRPAGRQLDRPGAELGGRGGGALARVAEDLQASADLDHRPVRGGADPGQPAVAVAPHHQRRDEDDDEQDQRHQAEGEELLGAGVEERRGRDDDHPEQRQRHQVEQRLRDQGAEQDREGLPHPARCGGTGRVPSRAPRGGPAGSPTSARRSSSPR